MSWASTIIYILQIETLNHFAPEHIASKYQIWEPILYLTPAAPLCSAASLSSIKQSIYSVY